MQKANSLPLREFGSYVLLETSRGGAEFALPLDESARPFCKLALTSFNRGQRRKAREILTFLLKSSLSEKLAKKLFLFTVPELALLAAYLLNVKRANAPRAALPSSRAWTRAVERLKGRDDPPGSSPRPQRPGSADQE